MNIVKAEAFEYRRNGLDSFHFTDPLAYLELNPGEIDRFRRNLTEVLHGQLSWHRLCAHGGPPQRNPKVNVETTINSTIPRRNSAPSKIVTQDKKDCCTRWLR